MRVSRLWGAADARGSNGAGELPLERSDAAGRFELELVPHPAVGHRLDARPTEHVWRSWEWPAGALAGERDLGDVHLARAGALVARAVGADGLPRAGWSFGAIPVAAGPPPAAPEVRPAFKGRPAEGTGEVRIDGLPAGEVSLKGHSLVHGAVYGPRTPVRAGEVGFVDVPVAQAGRPREIRLRFRTDPPRLAPRPEYVALSRAGRPAPPPEPGAPADGEPVLVFADVGPGLHAVEIADPLFLPWSSVVEAGVEAGAELVAELEGSAALAVEVATADGAPVAGLGLRLVYPLDGEAGTACTLLQPGADPPPGGLFPGLVPGEGLVLVAEAAGHARRELELETLLPGETRRVPVELERGFRLAGRAVGPNGAPSRGVEVRLEGGPSARVQYTDCLLYTSPSPRDQRGARIPSSA